jgi:penicillin-binding protein 1A
MFFRKRKRARREPVLDTFGSLLDLKVDARDRAGGAAMPRAYEERPARRETQRASKPKKPKRSRLGRLVYWGFVLTVWGMIAVVGLLIWQTVRLPSLQSLVLPKRPPTISIVGIDGHVLATRGDTGGVSIPVAAMPPYLPQAFIAIEDRRFRSHFGFDPIGIARAVLVNLKAMAPREGGSTLTQQLAKNLFLNEKRTLARKLDELVLALWLEATYSKDEILELYLNRVYFGSGAYGVEAAAQRYFGKSARLVTLGEAAVLAGLVKAPSRLAPNRNPKLARERAELVMQAMVDERLVTEEMVKITRSRPLTIVKYDNLGSAGYIADWIMDELEELVGRAGKDITVRTTIDSVLQAQAERALADELAAKGEKFGVTQGAVVAMDPDGAVRALVGGRNYHDSQFNRAINAKRQPGSAFKPFVFLTALERGLTPDSVREDAPINIKGWKPENYTKEYKGPVTLTTALSHSLNTVSVRLGLEVGPNAVIKTAHRLGINSKMVSNASIALGTSEVSLVELVSAYAPFANGGIGVVPHVVEQVKGADGSILFSRSTINSLGSVVAPPHVAMMNRMLEETLMTGTAQRARIPNWPAAGKTGTSQDFRDAWFVGYTGRLIAGVWLGNDDNSPTKRASGSSIPVDIWNRLMRPAHENVPPIALPGMDGRGYYNPPVQQAPVIDAPVSAPPLRNDSPMDNWLLDRLLGRR